MQAQPERASIVRAPLGITERGHKADYVCQYPYYGELGGLQFCKVRYAFRDAEAAGRPKTFRYHPRKTDGDTLVYRLPELLDAIRAGEPRVFVVEGEKDADTAAEYGHIATTAHQGGGPGSKVTAAQAGWFTGYSGQVWVVADNDVTGYATAWRWCQLLIEAGLGADQLRPVRARTGKDLTDHLRSGRAIAGLRRMTLEDLRTRAGRFTEEAATREGYGLFISPRKPDAAISSLRPINRKWL